MIKRQFRRASCRMPGSVRRIVRRANIDASIEHPREHHANRMTARIPTWVAEGADLFQRNSAYPGFFKEFSRRCIFKRLIRIHKAAWKSP